MRIARDLVVTWWCLSYVGDEGVVWATRVGRSVNRSVAQSHAWYEGESRIRVRRHDRWWSVSVVGWRDG